MFPAFTGSSRRPRQVNLSSNRSANPFLPNPPKGQTPTVHGAQAALAIAQQERIQRQLERDQITSSRTVQRVWRGYESRKITKNIWRKDWDAYERTRSSEYQPSTSSEGSPYPSSSECVKQLRLLLLFMEINNQQDVARLAYFSKCFQQTVEGIPSLSTEEGWTVMLSRLMKKTLNVLSTPQILTTAAFSIVPLLGSLVFLIKLIPKQMALQARIYYDVMAKLTIHSSTVASNAGLSRDCLVNAVIALLQPITSETLEAYEWFARKYLTIPSLQDYIGTLEDLASSVNYKLLASALDTQILPSQSFLQSVQVENRIWLLAYFIYFHRQTLGENAVNQAPEILFVKVISSLLSSAATDISQRLDPENYSDNEQLQDSTPLPPFARDQITSLVNQRIITHLLSRVGKDSVPLSGTDYDREPARVEAWILAKYALTLIRIFPKRGDEIRMWLYLGSASSKAFTTTYHVPAIKYFWLGTRLSKVYSNAVENPDGILDMLRPVQNTTLGENESRLRREQEQEWIIILLFLELYTFLLKVLDDEEFFSGGLPLSSVGSERRTPWTKESTLPLDDVKDLTIFLKNLAFTLYWNSADLTTVEVADRSIGMRDYFNTSGFRESVSSDHRKPEIKELGGVTGIPLYYFKGLVTGVLRMVHERDSRRNFLPDGHWLMTKRFDMAGFISAVVAEEENRHQLQDDEDKETEDEETEHALESSLGLVGTSRAQQVRRMELLRRRQQQVSRRKELEAIAPRLEILRNMPFAIPFNTRVRIFREFIHRDQLRRRKGFVDPDAWRLVMAQTTTSLDENGHPMGSELLSKHHADIRRTDLFEDAFEQFYPLGEAFKEPIQITFIDQFDTVEAGIDGGGVTKEFLTSIINDAFNPSGTLSLFAENDEHALYPNPESVEQEKAQLRETNIPERSATWNELIRELLKRFEFLGRIIGKCLYEGILVDINFAGFFLLKWALTGGSSSATRESAYRANLNDLRDLDKGLYQGLLQLKNYAGNVEDFALNFTVTDTVTVPGPDSKDKKQTITRELMPNGSNTPVTNSNRLVYISHIARHRLQIQPYLQTSAFLQGLGQIIQPSWLSMFNQGELQRLIGGDAVEIDVADLRRNTIYGGVYTIGDDLQEHPTVKLFWEVMQSMANEDRQKVLKFVTSTPRAPLLGFSHLNPRFSIRDSSSDEERLPSTSTCANLLKLPRYTKANTLREKLIYAVNAGAGFDLS